MRAELKPIDGLAFEASIRDHRIVLDAGLGTPGGKDRGPNPKEMLLSAIMACSAMDVVSLLGKYKIKPRSFLMSAEAETTEHHPKIFIEVEVVYAFELEQPIEGELPIAKLVEAVELSMTRYCGVSAMVTPTSPIYFTVQVNGSIEHRGQAKF